MKHTFATRLAKISVSFRQEADALYQGCPKTHLAEKEGFEPSELVRVHLISNQAHSATLSLLQCSMFSNFHQIL